MLIGQTLFGGGTYPADAAAIAASASFLGANVLPALWALPLHLVSRGPGR